MRKGTWEFLLVDDELGEMDLKGLRGRKDMITQNPEKAIKNILNGFRRFAKRFVLFIIFRSLKYR